VEKRVKVEGERIFTTINPSGVLSLEVELG